MLENVSEKSEDKLICKACGKDFSCGANTGKCWCFEIDLEKEALAEFRKNFQNCLCPDCLRKKRKIF
jgi:hypothetical protein